MEGEMLPTQIKPTMFGGGLCFQMVYLCIFSILSTLFLHLQL